MAAYGRPAGAESEDSDDDFAFYTPNSHQDEDNCSKPRHVIANSAQRVGIKKNTTVNKRRASSEESQMLENYRLGSMKGHLETIKEIVQSGIDIDHILKCNWTALMYACSSGHVEIVAYLLKNGANANFDKDLFTPLMAVCSSKCENEDDLASCATLLVQHEAKINCSEKHLVTPLMFATRGERKKVVKSLLELGADIDAQDNRGWTALSWAANSGHKDMVQILLEANADPTKACPSGEIASDLASAKGYTEIVSLLQEACQLKNLPVPELSPAVSKVSLNNNRCLLESKISFQPSPKTNTALLQEPIKSTKESTVAFQPLPKANCARVLQEPAKNYTRYGDLELFLAGLELSHLSNLFQENNFDFQAFLSTTDEELEKIGITSVGYRKKILGAIREVHKKEWEKTSLPAVQQKKTVSCPEVSAVVENITKHISYIHASITFLCKEMRLQPNNLELGKEAVNVATLNEQTSSALKTVKKLEVELQHMQSQLEKVVKRVEHIPADLIVSEKPASCNVQYSFKAKAVLIGIAVVGLFCVRPFMLHKFACLSVKQIDISKGGL